MSEDQIIYTLMHAGYRPGMQRARRTRLGLYLGRMSRFLFRYQSVSSADVGSDREVALR